MSVCGSFRPMICDCGSRNISTSRNIGWDITEDGEENQHMDTCLACGLKRFWVEHVVYGVAGRTEHFQGWSADGFGRPTCAAGTTEGEGETR